jgi:hypothetical protein
VAFDDAFVIVMSGPGTAAAATKLAEVEESANMDAARTMVARVAVSSGRRPIRDTVPPYMSALFGAGESS